MLYTYIHVYIYIYIHAYIHIYIYIYIYIYINSIEFEIVVFISAMTLLPHHRRRPVVAAWAD